MVWLCRRCLSDSTLLAIGMLVMPMLGCLQHAPPTAPNPVAAPTDGSVSVVEPTTTKEKTSEGPPEATIKAMLEKDMWGPPEQGGTVHTYNYKSLKVATPRKGNYLTDGTPANTDTNVYPVKVVVEVVRTFTDGTSKQEEKNQSYVFFKDEFGDWSYRFVQNN